MKFVFPVKIKIPLSSYQLKVIGLLVVVEFTNINPSHEEGEEPFITMIDVKIATNTTTIIYNC